MSGLISKSNIQDEYNTLINSGMDDWEARATVINNILTSDENSENYYSPGSADYYFIVSQIWGLCG
jgi:hypothetical protein